MYLYIHLYLYNSPDQNSYLQLMDLHIHLTRQLPVANVLIYSPDQTVTCSYCTYVFT